MTRGDEGTGIMGGKKGKGQAMEQKGRTLGHGQWGGDGAGREKDGTNVNEQQ